MWGIRPKDDKFYDLFEASSKAIYKATLVLEKLMDDHKNIDVYMTELNELEHHGDEITRNIMEKLNQTFITPLDREDIMTLAQNLDHILDFMQGACERMLLYKTGKPTPFAKELVLILIKTAKMIEEAIHSLRNLRLNHHQIMNLCQDINRLESEGDRLYRVGVANLFEEVKDPIELIKWKEVYEHLETALDHCEDIADIIKGVVLKYV